MHWTLHCSLQSVFDQLEGEELRRARTKSNPYETIRGAFFLNRYIEGFCLLFSIFTCTFAGGAVDLLSKSFMCCTSVVFINCLLYLVCMKYLCTPLNDVYRKNMLIG